MKATDIAALMKGIAPVIKQCIDDAVAPLAAKIADLERDLKTTKSAIRKAAKK